MLPSPTKTAPVLCPAPAQETYSAGLKMERSGIALESQIVDRYGLATKREIAKLPVGGIGIWSRWRHFLRKCMGGNGSIEHTTPSPSDTANTSAWKLPRGKENPVIMKAERKRAKT